MILDLEIRPLDGGAFAPFGDVIETAGAAHFAINEGSAERFHDLAAVDVAAAGGRPLINIFRGRPRRRPIEIRMMERHPLGTQTFMPLQPWPYVIVVAAAGETIALGALRAFHAAGTQGVNYHRDTWHHPLLVLHDDHDFLVVDRGGPGENCIEHHFAEGFARLTV